MENLSKTKGKRSIPQTGLVYPSFLRATRRFLFLIELHISSVHHPPIFPRSTPQRRSLPISLARNPDPGYHSSPINENVKWLNELFSPGLYFLEASFFLKICSLQLRTIAKVSSNHERSLVAPGYRARISVDDFTLYSSLDPRELGSTMLLQEMDLDKINTSLFRIE